MCAIMSGIATIACLNLVSDEYCENLPDDSVTFSYWLVKRALSLAKGSDWSKTFARVECKAAGNDGDGKRHFG